MPAPSPALPRPKEPAGDALSGYRGRTQAENARTQEIVIEMARALDHAGGYVLVNELETRALFRHSDLAGKRVLEVGCGTLPVTMSVPSDQMPRLFVASDVNLKIVAVARDVDRRPHYLVCSALDAPLKPGSLDYIVLNGVLHHLPPDCNLLGALSALLAPGGRLLLLEPNVSCLPAEAIKWALRRFFGLSMEASPYGQFSRRTISRLVDRAGLRVDREWFASLFAFPLTGGQGRCRVVPDSRPLFRALCALDEAISRVLHALPWLARLLHWRVLLLLERRDAPAA